MQRRHVHREALTQQSLCYIVEVYFSFPTSLGHEERQQARATLDQDQVARMQASGVLQDLLGTKPAM